MRVAFKFSKADTGSNGNNTNTECRIQRVAGVYVDGSSGSDWDVLMMHCDF